MNQTTKKVLTYLAALLTSCVIGLIATYKTSPFFDGTAHHLSSSELTIWLSLMIISLPLSLFIFVCMISCILKHMNIRKFIDFATGVSATEDFVKGITSLAKAGIMILKEHHQRKTE